MIKQVSLSGFNAQNTVYDLSQHVLLLGKRGSGKSSVCKALKFCLQPIASANIQGEFQEHYSQASGTEKFSATLTLDTGQIITRELSRSAKGEIRQAFLSGDKKLTRTQEATFLQDLGIILPDIDNFLDLSDQKKIEKLFQIFPCEVDVEKLTDQIDRSKEQENELQRKVLGKREAIQSLEEQLTAFPVASGATIELLQGEIAQIEAAIQDLAEQLKEEEAKRREQAAATSARLKAEKNAAEASRLTVERLEGENRAKIAEARREEQERAENAKIEQENGITLEEGRENLRRWEAETRPEFAFPEKETGIKITRLEALIAEDVAEQDAQQQEEREDRCQDCLASLSEIIDKVDKTVLCYECGAEQISPLGLIQLKMLRRSIENATN